jgi:ATP-dependent helicase/nuclease subunit A
MPARKPIDSLEATRPDRNATVSASAGSGKTWLLVTRIIRLLLAGAEPGGILALTFTRKAAAEMQLRLQQRLLQMASVGDSELTALLRQAGIDGDDVIRQRARRLYENLLHAPYPPRTLTFHAFCQEILAFFPLEADVPPGFELIEDTALLQQQAWEALFADATRNPQQSLANDLDVLMQACNGPANTRTSLNSLLGHRNDWWACTENATDPAAFASRQLQRHLQVDEETEPYALFFNRVQRDDIQTFAALLQKHATKTNQEHAGAVFAALESWRADANTFTALQAVFLTQQQQPRSRKGSNAQAKSMGADGEQTFLDLHERTCEAMLHTLDLLKRRDTLALNAVWYRIGQRYIDQYQRLKAEQRLLDFTDLEWNCYRLLSASDNALWVQYRIDRRIDHVLIDEFQDTNPTQWQLITPLLQEIAAGDDQRRRSIFLVGDEKQSIYSFRRANPALQAQASQWLAQSMSAVAVPLDASRRSSPAIIDAVNGIFGQESVRAFMPGFSTHDTWLRELPGSVTLLPLCAEDVDEDETTRPVTAELMLRNPLLQPRVLQRKTARLNEAKLIADSIEALLAKPEMIVDEGGNRAIDYGDIMILLRNRTHLHEYEAVLRERGIPYLGGQRGSLLDNQEIRDMETLLDSLITPYNNLAVAQLLKSPVFAASDDDLIALAQVHGNRRWFERLQTIATDYATTHPLARAARLLPHWRALADTVPVHDLLDRIYAEANIIARYAASVPEHQRYRVTANLQRFLELSLELDSGRYPSLSHFLHYLRSLRSHADSPPDEPASSPPGSQVRIMTIHASKGLEAPVVYLADCNNRAKHNNAYTALVDWPADSERPVLFQLVTGAQKTDSITEQLQQRKDQAQYREELNLLYVALTRARQHLIISGVEVEKQHSSGWFELIHQGLLAASARETDGVLRLSAGAETKPVDAARLRAPVTVASKIAVSPELKRPITRQFRRDYMIAPSYRLSESREMALSAGETQDDDGATRGIVIHRALDLLSREQAFDEDQLLAQISAEAGMAVNDPDLLAWLEEARGIFHDARFAEIFSPPAGCRCYNEMPVLYRHENRAVYGLIDRLVVKPDGILLIDYKSRRIADGEDASAPVSIYREQMCWYRQGVEKIWPDRPIRTALLFTCRAELVWMPSDPAGAVD